MHYMEEQHIDEDRMDKENMSEKASIDLDLIELRATVRGWSVTRNIAAPSGGRAGPHPR